MGQYSVNIFNKCSSFLSDEFVLSSKTYIITSVYRPLLIQKIMQILISPLNWYHWFFMWRFWHWILFCLRFYRHIPFRSVDRSVSRGIVRRQVFWLVRIVCVSAGFQMWLCQLVMVALCYADSSATFVKAAGRAVWNGSSLARRGFCYFDIVVRIELTNDFSSFYSHSAKWEIHHNIHWNHKCLLQSRWSAACL